MECLCETAWDPKKTKVYLVFFASPVFNSARHYFSQISVFDPFYVISILHVL